MRWLTIIEVDALVGDYWCLCIDLMIIGVDALVDDY